MEGNSIGAENSLQCSAASASRTSYDAGMEREGLYQIFPLFPFSPFLFILSDFHCHRVYFERGLDGSLLFFCICFVIIMFETLVASDSFISASSRSVPLSLFHGTIGVNFFQHEETQEAGNMITQTTNSMPRTRKLWHSRRVSSSGYT